MIFGSILLILAIVVLIIGGLSWSGRLPGNSFIGLHVPEVRKSRELWVLAHRIAGPFWTLSGVILLFGAAFSFRVSGWLWLVPIALLLLAIIGIGFGAGQGANAVAGVDARRLIDAENGTLEPKLDLDALRRAAQASDD